MKFLYSNLYKHSHYQSKISPNNYYVANVVDNRLVLRKNDQDLMVLQVHETRRPIDYVQWAPDSQYILCVNYENCRVDVRSVTDSKWQASISDKTFPFVRVKWSPDSKNIICVAELGLRIAIWNLSTTVMKFINHAKYSEKGIETSPNGEHTAIIEKYDGKDYVSIYHANSFILLQRFELDTVDVENIKWSPNSMYIAAWDACLYHKLSVYRQDGALIKSYSGYEYGLGIKSVHWSPTSQIIALGNFDDTIHVLSTLSWQLVGTLRHPTTLGASTETNIFEETVSQRPEVSTFPTSNIYYRHALKRPFNIPARRVDYNEFDPKVGIGSFSFSSDGLYICSKSDLMPSVVWIWQLSTLKCIHLLVFKNPIKQAMWNPAQDHSLALTCNDKNIHFIELTVENEGIDAMPMTVPTDDFSIKQFKWSRKGDTMLLLDQDLFCLAMTQ
ncbi:WD40-repeat-containing domain protein [Parasitella parasitica]|nr:WD40-repeat-containing domain protein [Parasitella parasitica]